MWSICQPMIRGWCTVRLLLLTQGGIPCRGFFGVASDSRSVLDLESVTSEDLGGAGVTGDMTGMAVGHSTTITPSSRTAETLVTMGSIMVISATAMVISATVTSTTAASATATRSTEVR